MEMDTIKNKAGSQNLIGFLPKQHLRHHMHTVNVKTVSKSKLLCLGQIVDKANQTIRWMGLDKYSFLNMLISSNT